MEIQISKVISSQSKNKTITYDEVIIKALVEYQTNKYYFPVITFVNDECSLFRGIYFGFDKYYADINIEDSIFMLYSKKGDLKCVLNIKESIGLNNSTYDCYPYILRRNLKLFEEINPSVTVLTCDEFEIAFKNACVGDFIFMPLGYLNRRNNSPFIGWIGFHFCYGNKLKIIDTFFTKTKEMIIVENLEGISSLVTLHSSTYQIYKNSKLSLTDNYLKYVSSKMIALYEFIDKRTKYAVVSKNDFLRNENNIDFKWRIIYECQPTMGWILYEVEENTNE